MNKVIEMKNAEFCEISTEELILLCTAVDFASHLLPEDHEDQKRLQALLEKLKRF